MLTENQRQELAESERVKTKLLDAGQLVRGVSGLRVVEHETAASKAIRIKASELPSLEKIEPYKMIARSGGTAGAQGGRDGRVIRSTDSFS